MQGLVLVVQTARTDVYVVVTPTAVLQCCEYLVWTAKRGCGVLLGRTSGVRPPAIRKGWKKKQQGGGRSELLMAGQQGSWDAAKSGRRWSLVRAGCPVGSCRQWTQK